MKISKKPCIYLNWLKIDLNSKLFTTLFCWVWIITIDTLLSFLELFHFLLIKFYLSHLNALWYLTDPVYPAQVFQPNVLPFSLFTWFLQGSVQLKNGLIEPKCIMSMMIFQIIPSNRLGQGAYVSCWPCVSTVFHR